MILVDTSIWIDHLRRGEPGLAALLEDGRVLAHPWVTGEIALGHLSRRSEILGLLGSLPQATVATDREVLTLIDNRHLFGTGIGWVDAHLLAATMLTAHARLWTRDRRLATLAHRHGLGAGDEPGPTPPAVGLVRIVPDDWREFRDVRLAALREAPRAFGATYADWADAGEQRWRARLTDVPFTVVARGGDGPVGVVSGAEAGDGVELISMWVAPAHRGTGLARRLIDQVVAWAASRGQRTCLMVREDNPVAIRAYLRAGFVDHGVPADQPADRPPERRMWHPGSAG